VSFLNSIFALLQSIVDQKAFLRQRIAKEKQQLHKLCDENQNLQIREFMFGCLKEEMDVYLLDKQDLRDLSSFIDKYLNEILTKYGESCSSLPLIVADAATPVGFNGHI
ncbi:hypothetical protein CARUB_v10022335mg, partial [Capsella rubella]